MLINYDWITITKKFLKSAASSNVPSNFEAVNRRSARNIPSSVAQQSSNNQFIDSPIHHVHVTLCVFSSLRWNDSSAFPNQFLILNTQQLTSNPIWAFCWDFMLNFFVIITATESHYEPNSLRIFSQIFSLDVFFSLFFFYACFDGFIGTLCRCLSRTMLKRRMKASTSLANLATLVMVFFSFYSTLRSFLYFSFRFFGIAFSIVFEVNSWARCVSVAVDRSGFQSQKKRKKEKYEVCWV